MKKIFLAAVCVTALWSCKTAYTSNSNTTKDEVQVNINLNEIKNDKVLVTVSPPKIKTDEISFQLPKTVPGTYSEDNYGKYIENLKAYDNKGNSLTVNQTNENSWSIPNAKKLDKITYWVNDTYDTETGKGFGGGDIFSPSGSNIEAGKNIMLNTHCFVGYFSDYLSVPYKVTVAHPSDLWGATSMTDQDPSTTNDLFVTPKYAELVENPIMYSKPNYTTFTIDNMDILIAVYSPTGKFTAESITPGMKTVMTAQKQFLGPINTTKKYSILLYLSTLNNDAMGFGALEHPTATTVVFPEIISKDELEKSMKDVVSHEFFHILTPLTVHSKEIENFDYNAPKMSEHLWMYEGTTEYFANLFQINQGLIDEDDFYNRLTEKTETASKMNDTMSFTTMSKNVLTEPYKSQYLNVYAKGTLISMCLDIIIRENSGGKKGILDLMQQLSNEYGASKAFNDEELFAKITELTYPEVGDFIKKHISGTTPIPYETYLSKVGVAKSIKKVPSNIFLKGQSPYITINQSTKEILIIPNIELNDFYTNLGLKGGDIILAINNKPYSMDTIFELLTDSQNWKENEPISLKIKRDNNIQVIEGTVKFPFEEKEVFEAADESKKTLKEAWLKGQ